MLNTLANGPDGFWECFKYYFSADVRVVKRPLEALHFLVMFKMFDFRPVGYHVFNLIMDIISAWLFYLCLVRATGSKIVGLLCASLFLLYPSHNATHYWVVCSSVTLSLIFYFGSLLANIEAEIRGNAKLHLLAAFLFLAGVLNYEVFVPLAAVNVLMVLLIAWKNCGFKKVIRSGVLVVGLFGLATAIASAYISWIVKVVGSAWLHHVMFDANLMLTTLTKGIYYNLPFVAFDYFFKMVAVQFQYGFLTTDWILLVCLVFLFCISVLLVFINEDSSENKSIETESIFPQLKMLASYSSCAWLFGLGIFTIIISYTIFGLNDSYEPTFVSLVNRVNTGASIGVTFSFAALLMAGSNLLLKSANKKMFCLIALLVTVPMMAIFTMTNWSLSRPYRLSWQLQSHIIKSIKDNAEKYKNVKSLLLANVPRYVDEAPVFDGVWDFQPMLRLTLSNSSINGGVVSDRMKVYSDKITDSRGLMILGTYKFDDLYVLVSPQCDLVSVDSANQFVDLIEKRGMTYELNKNLPKQWRGKL